MKTKFSILIFAGVLTLILSSCGNGFKTDTYSKDDMCIIKVGDSKAKVCYGDSRSDVEKVLGNGEKNEIKSFDYNSGVSIFYRNDVVAGIVLNKESKNLFKTARGAGIGMLKVDIKKLIGEKYAIEDSTNDKLEYIIDSENNKFTDKTTLALAFTKEEKQSFYVVSVYFNEDGYSREIELIDDRMDTFYN